MRINRLAIILSMLALIFNFGCSQPEKNMQAELPYQINWSDFIDNSNEITKLSSIASNINYIALKSPDSVKVGIMFEMHLTKDNIFILDQTFSIFVFDIQGNFKVKINHLGRGPNEYLGANGIMINEDTNLIALHSGNKVFFYDFQGNFVKVIEIEGVSNEAATYPVSAKWITGDMYLGLMHVAYIRDNDPDPVAAFIFNSDGKITKKFRYYSDEKRPESFDNWYPASIGMLTGVSEGVMVRIPYIDTTFIIDKNLERHPFIINNFGEYRASREYMENPENRNPGSLSLKSIKIITYPRTNLFRGYTFNTFTLNNQSYSGVWDIRNKTAFSIPDAAVGLKDDIDFGMPFLPPRFGVYTDNPDILVDIIEPVRLLSDKSIVLREGSQLAEIMKDLSIDDNPVIRILETKTEIKPED